MAAIAVSRVRAARRVGVEGVDIVVAVGRENLWSQSHYHMEQGEIEPVPL